MLESQPAVSACVDPDRKGDGNRATRRDSMILKSTILPGDRNAVVRFFSSPSSGDIRRSAKSGTS